MVEREIVGCQRKNHFINEKDQEIVHLKMKAKEVGEAPCNQGITFKLHRERLMRSLIARFLKGKIEVKHKRRLKVMLI